MAKFFKTIFKLRRGKSEAWDKNNPLLAYGEPGYDKDKNILKVGDGERHWNELDPIGGAETDPTVPEWAKQPTKPTYTASEVGALPDTTVIPSIEGLASEEYVDDKIAAIPTPDVSGQIDTHNTSTDAHANMGWLTSEDEVAGNPTLIDADTLNGRNSSYFDTQIAVERARIDKLSNCVTPQMFGAVGDGDTDDTDAIMAARDAAIDTKKALYFPAGTYMIHNPIELWSNCEIYGDGNNTVIKKIAAVTEVLKPIGTKGSFIAGQKTFTVADGSKYKVGYSCYAGIDLENWDFGVHGVIESINGNDVTVKAYPKSLESGSLVTGLLSAELIYDNYKSFKVVFSTSFPVFCTFRYTTDGKSNPIHDVYIHDLTIDGDRQDSEAKTYHLSLINFSCQDYDTGSDYRESIIPNENIRLENLNLYNSPADGVSLQSCKHMYVTNCITKNCAYNGVHFGVGSYSGSIVGCKLNADYCGYFDCAGVTSVTVSDNTFDHCATGIGGLDSVTRGITINGNAFRGCNLGIRAGNTLNPQNTIDQYPSNKYTNTKGPNQGITICNNVFYGEDLNGIGISFEKGSHFIANGNTFRNLATAIEMGATSHNRVSNNIIKDCVTPLSMIRGDDTASPLTYNSAFVGNIVHSELTGTSAAITIANAENMLVTGNIVTGTSASVIIDASTTSSVISENNVISVS